METRISDGSIDSGLIALNVKAMALAGRADRTQPADLNSAGRLRAPMWACRSRTNADDRLPLDARSRVECGDGGVEGRDVADVRPQSSVPDPLDDLIQLGTIGLDNEVDHQAGGGPRIGRPDDGHQCSSGSNQACGPLPDVAAGDIETQIAPPMTSNTRSTPPTSSRTLFSRSTNSFAPKSSTV